ncbi:MAG: hypothetical protein RL591_1563 [Planctomycetota bacterium]
MRRFAFNTFALAVASVAACATTATRANDLTLLGSIGSPQGAPYDVFASDIAFADAGALVVGIRGADTVAPSAGAVEVYAQTAEGWERVARPTLTGIAAGDQLGEAVAAHGSWFAAGAPRNDARGSDAGAVVIARLIDGVWTQAATLLPPAATSAGAHFGAALAMTDDRLAIGAPRASGGGFVEVYRRVGDVWTFESRLANPTPSTANRYGDAVALGADASGVPLLVIGDPADDAIATDAGSARVFRFEDGQWRERAVLTAASARDRVYFGQSVAVAAGVVAVGAYAELGGYPKNEIEEAGAVEIFAPDPVEADSWLRVATLASTEPLAYASFGWDVALEARSTNSGMSRSGMSWLLVVGEPGASVEGGVAQSGRVHCLRSSDALTWEALANARLAPSSPQAVFGAAVALSGGVCAFAAPGAAVLGSPQGLAASLDLSTDCDTNGVPDAIDIANGARDSNGDGILDACEPLFDVPDVYPTIQAAIDAVPVGVAKTITVAPGVYNESFALNGKNVVVQGAPEGGTILDGTGLTTAIASLNGEPATAGLENLAFQNGIVGAQVNPPNPTFTGGGAVFGKLSAAFIRHCSFTGCRAKFGGAVYLLRCEVNVDTCTFTNNESLVDGGALQTFASSGVLRNSTFTGNRCALSSAGSGSALKAVGIKSAGTMVTLEQCLISGNIVPSAGAAVEYYENAEVLAGTLRVVDTNIVNNLVDGGTPNDAAGLRVLGSQAACVLSDGTTICGNTPRNVEGPYLAEGEWTVCDCLADFTNDGYVSAADLSLLLTWWSVASPSGVGDVNHDGVVNAADLSMMLVEWGGCKN